MSIKLGMLTVDANTTLDGAMNLDMIIVDSSLLAITITLDENPLDGTTYYIKDMGNAAANNITIDGDTYLIDSAGTITMNTNYQIVRVMFCATNGKWFKL